MDSILISHRNYSLDHAYDLCWATVYGVPRRTPFHTLHNAIRLMFDLDAESQVVERATGRVVASIRRREPHYDVA